MLRTHVLSSLTIHPSASRTARTYIYDITNERSIDNISGNRTGTDTFTVTTASTSIFSGTWRLCGHVANAASSSTTTVPTWGLTQQRAFKVGTGRRWCPSTIGGGVAVARTAAAATGKCVPWLLIGLGNVL